MIFDLILLLFFQPLIGSLFFFLAPILNDFFKEDFKSLQIKIFLFSLLSDLIFLKPLGFFLFLVSLSLFLLSFLEKFIGSYEFYQRLLFLFVFNFLFLFLFSFFTFTKLNFSIFKKIFLFNFLFQLLYIEIKRFFFK